MSETRQREKSVLVRMTTEEYEMIKAKADVAQVSIPEFLRQLGLKEQVRYPLIRKEDAADIAKQIRYIGNNLNQLMKLAHQGIIRPAEVQDAAQKELERVWQQLSSYQRGTQTN